MKEKSVSRSNTVQKKSMAIFKMRNVERRCSILFLKWMNYNLTDWVVLELRFMGKEQYSMHPQSVHIQISFAIKTAATTTLYIVKAPLQQGELQKVASWFHLCGTKGWHFMPYKLQFCYFTNEGGNAPFFKSWPLFCIQRSNELSINALYWISVLASIDVLLSKVTNKF